MSAALSLLAVELCGVSYCCLAGWLSWPSLTPCRAFSSAESRAWLANGLQEQRKKFTDSKISGLCHFGSCRPNPDPYRVILKLFWQHSLLAQSFASSGWIELLHLDVTCGPPREPQWKKRCLTHRCLPSSSQQLPKSCLESWQVFARRQRRPSVQQSSENSLTHA